MSAKISAVLLIIVLACIIPSASAQEIKIGEKAEQKPVEVTISETGDVHVRHVVNPSSSPKQIDLVNGTVQNLTITDSEGNPKTTSPTVGENDAVLILPSKTPTIIEYDLQDAISLKDGIWTWDFLYLDTTTFLIPEKADWIYVNNRPVNMESLKGFTCHGCQMTLAYSINEPKVMKNVEWEGKEFAVEIQTLAEVEDFAFDQPTKTIAFDVSGNGFVTATIPLELLWGPYAVFLDDEKIFFNQPINNGTHVWLSMKPQDSGKISIVGTTAVPEFPLVVPLAIGISMIIIIPMIRKISLR